MRTVSVVRRWTIRFRPINGVGKKEREPRRFDGTHGQYNRAIRADGEEFTLAITSTSRVWTTPPSACTLTTRDNGEITSPIRQLFGSFVTGIRYVR